MFGLKNNLGNKPIKSLDCLSKRHFSGWAKQGSKPFKGLPEGLNCLKLMTGKGTLARPADSI
jgi:hypothetical protein